jgi:hypothetical protein
LDNLKKSDHGAVKTIGREKHQILGTSSVKLNTTMGGKRKLEEYLI